MKTSACVTEAPIDQAKFHLHHLVAKLGLYFTDSATLLNSISNEKQCNQLLP